MGSDIVYKYPIRMISIKSGVVIEFTDLTTGTIIKLLGDNNSYSIGYYSRYWCEHTNKDKWKPYNPIWLQQKK